jgi:large subunit ribosomal protein L25
MEKTLLLKADVRTKTGTKESAKLRKNGRVPATVYGHKEAPTSLSLNAHEFVQGLHHGHRFMEVEIEGKPESMIVKDLQYDYLGRDIVHIDFMRVDMTERIKVQVPIELKGSAKGSTEDGIIEEHASRLEIECLVTSMPDTILVNIKDVGVGDVLHAGDIELPEGIDLVSPVETLLVTCHMKAAAVSAEDAEGDEDAASSPEVITEKKEDE